MTISLSEAQSRAIASFQVLLSKHQPESSPYRIAERALDLVFNGRSVLDDFDAQELLTEAEQLIAKQVQARLLVQRPTPDSEPAQPIARGLRRMVWSGRVRASMHIELWLTEHRGGGHAFAC
ncbi:hypothetical protein [Paracidovorax konjaci]|uniref:Uncharacterized protein n=1 Tax=Paracidovorax konjaci TaxID=32040 RepID=A0A1I1X0P9_9BURK|nr:hypothetical protein [Paracidovorax konjaci]SFE00909.1 hypothetical protein SAMN04489710_111137 [Paracidovorax konjaci]